MSDIVDAVLCMDRYEFIRLSGELINFRFMNDHGIYTNHIDVDENESDDESIDYEIFSDTKLESYCTDDNIFYKRRLEIYFNTLSDEFNFRDSLEFVSNLYKTLSDKDFIISKDNAEYEELELLLNVNHTLAEAMRIGTQNEMMPYFGYGNTQYEFFITDRDDRTKIIRKTDLIQLDKFYVNKIYEIKLYAKFGDYYKHRHNDKFMDVFKLSINNNDEFVCDMPTEELKMSLSNRVVNISLKNLNHTMALQGAFSNNQLFKGLLNQIYVMHYKKWKIYLNYVDCECNSKNCLCKLILNSDSIKAIKLGIISCAKNYEKDLMLIDNEILTYIEEKGRYRKNGHEYLFYSPNRLEFSSNSLVVDSSYRVFITIMNRLILNKEFLEYSYRPDNFIKFRLEEMDLE